MKSGVFSRYFVEFQGLQEITPLTEVLKDIFYDECQGITAVAVNLFILAQERALAEGEESITGGIIRNTAKEDLHMIQPMIKALRNNNSIEIMKYEDISINLDDLAMNYKSTMELNGKVEALFKERKNTIELSRKSIVENLVLDLTSMGMFNNLNSIAIKKLCEKIVQKAPVDEDYNNLKMSALKKAMELEERVRDSPKESEKVKEKKEGLIYLYDLAKKNKEHPYEVLKRNGFIKDPIDEFLKVQ